MPKGIAINPINVGYIDEMGKNVVKAFAPNDQVDLPDDVFADLVAAKAVAAEPTKGSGSTA